MSVCGRRYYSVQKPRWRSSISLRAIERRSRQSRVCVASVLSVGASEPGWGRNQVMLELDHDLWKVMSIAVTSGSDNSRGNRFFMVICLELRASIVFLTNRMKLLIRVLNSVEDRASHPISKRILGLTSRQSPVG